MQQDKLSRIIARKNERLEEDAVNEAENLIAAIVLEQQKIKDSEGRIAEYREELRKLEVQQLDESVVLGGS